MTFIFYKDKTGKIKSHHPAPKQITGEDLAVEVQKYNERKECGRTAHIVEVAEGSFEAYLLEQLSKNTGWRRKPLPRRWKQSTKRGTV